MIKKLELTDWKCVKNNLGSSKSLKAHIFALSYPGMTSLSLKNYLPWEISSRMVSCWYLYKTVIGLLLNGYAKNMIFKNYINEWATPSNYWLLQWFIHWILILSLYSFFSLFFFWLIDYPTFSLINPLIYLGILFRLSKFNRMLNHSFPNFRWNIDPIDLPVQLIVNIIFLLIEWRIDVFLCVEGFTKQKNNIMKRKKKLFNKNRNKMNRKYS